MYSFSKFSASRSLSVLMITTTAPSILRSVFTPGAGHLIARQAGQKLFPLKLSSASLANLHTTLSLSVRSSTLLLFNSSLCYLLFAASLVEKYVSAEVLLLRFRGQNPTICQAASRNSSLKISQSAAESKDWKGSKRFLISIANALMHA